MLFYGLVGPYGRKPNRSKLPENTRKGDWKINDKIDEKNSKKIRKKKKEKEKKSSHTMASKNLARFTKNSTRFRLVRWCLCRNLVTMPMLTSALASALTSSYRFWHQPSYQWIQPPSCVLVGSRVG